MRRLASQQALTWVLEKDNPSVRYFALRDLLGKPETDPEVRDARKAIMQSGPVKRILSLQKPGGWWTRPEGVFVPMHQGSGWQVAFLAELGADPEHPRVRKGVEHVLAKMIQKGSSGFTIRRSSYMDCYLGVALEALLRLGWAEDERVKWLLGYTCGVIKKDNLRCKYRQGLSCPWGGEKELRALARIPERERPPEVKAALERIAGFLLKYDLARAAYPRKNQTSEHWFKFGFPRTYTADILEILEALCLAGYGRERKLGPAIEYMLTKQGKDGTWTMEYSPNGKMLADIEEKGKPSKWVTLRALRVLKARYG